MNSPRIFATSIVPRNMDEASERIERCPDFTEDDKLDARRIIKSLISERSRSRAGTAEAESRVDYLSDMLGIETRKVISIVERMRVAGILAKDDDMTAYLRLVRSGNSNITSSWRDSSPRPSSASALNSA